MKTKHIILIFLPAILIVVFALFASAAQYEPTYEAVDKNKQPEKPILNFVPIFPADPILGKKSASKTIIMFADIGCGRCGEQMEIFRQLIQIYPDKIKIIWKSLDVINFPNSSVMAHAYTYCANSQGKFEEFEKITSNNEAIDTNSLKNYAAQAQLDKIELESCLLSDALKTYKQKNKQLASNFRIQAVPTIFINNEIIQEPLTLEGWETFLLLE